MPSTVPDVFPIKRALVSVYYKEGLDTLCKALTKHRVEIYATRGTGEYLEKSFGVRCQPIEALTQFPEMMDGRVKTLHPRIFGGVLARRENKQDMEEATRFEVPLFDLVVVNLYPFAEHLGKEATAQVPYIDIGGPSLVRASAKNFAAVTVLSDPADYNDFVAELDRNNGATSRQFRYKQAAKSFRRTGQYDAMIASQWEGGAQPAAPIHATAPPAPMATPSSAPDALPSSISLMPQAPLRYGENPHQRAAWCGTQDWELLQGKELSYNNLLDAEAAVRIVEEIESPTVAIVKHNNPCGVCTAAANTPIGDIYQRALDSDTKSAFGGIVAVNREVDATAAQLMGQIFLEVIIARGFTAEARELLSKKKNLRLLSWPRPIAPRYDVRASLGGWLLQTSDDAGIPPKLVTVTRTTVPENCQADLWFSWLVCKYVKSNAIVIAKTGVTVGIGAGQMSRVDAVKIALERCRPEDRQGAVLASDAFFPFRDNIDLIKDSGIAAIIQPGGSQRDEEVIAACDDYGIAMVFTGQRHFRH